MSFQLNIITPSGKVFEDTVDSISATGLEGGFEVFSGHACLLSALKDGQFKIRKSGIEQIYKTASGIIEVQPDHNVLVLVDSANPVT